MKNFYKNRLTNQPLEMYEREKSGLWMGEVLATIFFLVSLFVLGAVIFGCLFLCVNFL